MIYIITVLIFLILIYILYNIFELQNVLSNKENTIKLIENICKKIEANKKKEFFDFLNEQKTEYITFQKEISSNLNDKIDILNTKLETFENKTKDIEKTIENLEKTIIQENKTFNNYVKNRVIEQEVIVKNIEMKLKNSTNKISQLNNQLMKCKKKIERLKNGNTIK